MISLALNDPYRIEIDERANETVVLIRRFNADDLEICLVGAGEDALFEQLREDGVIEG
jgi:hypothetical protein